MATGILTYSLKFVCSQGGWNEYAVEIYKGSVPCSKKEALALLEKMKGNLLNQNVHNDAAWTNLIREVFKEANECIRMPHKISYRVLGRTTQHFAVLSDFLFRGEMYSIEVQIIQGSGHFSS